MSKALQVSRQITISNHVSVTSSELSANEHKRFR